jgi:hypothetical protein
MYIISTVNKETIISSDTALLRLNQVFANTPGYARLTQVIHPKFPTYPDMLPSFLTDLHVVQYPEKALGTGTNIKYSTAREIVTTSVDKSTTTLLTQNLLFVTPEGSLVHIQKARLDDGTYKVEMYYYNKSSNCVDSWSLAQYASNEGSINVTGGTFRSTNTLRSQNESWYDIKQIIGAYFDDNEAKDTNQNPTPTGGVGLPQNQNKAYVLCV